MKEIQPKSILWVQAGDFKAIKKNFWIMYYRMSIRLSIRNNTNNSMRSQLSSTIQGPDFIASDDWNISIMSLMGLAIHQRTTLL